jgi:hypothetical protein
VTRASLREYAAVQRERYQHATRAEKHQLLDERVTVTGMHRKAAIRLLRRAPRPPTGPSRAGRPRSYGPDVAAAAEVLWPASGRIGAHRLHPFVGELLERLIRCGELTVAPAVEKLVRQASRPTLARLLAPARAQCPPRGFTTTQPGTWLKHEIPIRTFTEWADARPGFCEVDLIAHWGSSPQGFDLCTLCAVDIATTWVELEAVWGRGRSGSAPPCTTSARASRCRWWGSTVTTDRSSSTTGSTLVSARGDHLHAQPRLQEERRGSCRAEERRRRPPARRL